jgi:hypothetical protein
VIGQEVSGRTISGLSKEGGIDALLLASLRQGRMHV